MFRARPRATPRCCADSGYRDRDRLHALGGGGVAPRPSGDDRAAAPGSRYGSDRARSRTFTTEIEVRLLAPDAERGDVHAVRRNIDLAAGPGGEEVLPGLVREGNHR